MNPSLYSALLKSMQDEAEGAAAPPQPPQGEAPPLSGPEVVEPPPQTVASLGVTQPEDPKDTLAKAFAQFSPPAEDVAEPTPAPTAPAVPAAKPPEESDASIVSRRVKEMMGLYGPPRTPHTNENTLASNIGRIGETFGSAIAGVKPDNSFYDNLDKQGAAEAAARNTADSEFDSFKKAIMAKAMGDLADKKKEKMDFESADAAFSTDTRLAPQWAEYKAECARKGIKANPEIFMKMQGGIRSAVNATDNNIRGIEARDASREDSQQFQRENMVIAADIATAKKQYEEDLKDARDSRQAVHPNRVALRPNIDETTARHQREADADSQYVTSQIDRLRRLIKQVGPDVERVIPGFRGEIISLRQAVAAAMLHANGYGVPTGKDWEMVDREIGNPTQWIDLVTHSADTQLEQALRSINAKTDAKAEQAGYGPYKTGSGLEQLQNQPKPAAPNFRGITGQGGAVPAPQAPQAAPTTGPASAKPVSNTKTTPSGKPYAVKAVDEHGQTVYFDANGDEVL